MLVGVGMQVQKPGPNAAVVVSAIKEGGPADDQHIAVGDTYTCCPCFRQVGQHPFSSVCVCTADLMLLLCRVVAVLGSDTHTMSAEQCAGLLLGEPDSRVPNPVALCTRPEVSGTDTAECDQVPVTVWSEESGERQLWLPRRREPSSYTPVFDFHRQKRPVPKGEFSMTSSGMRALDISQV